MLHASKLNELAILMINAVTLGNLNPCKCTHLKHMISDLTHCIITAL